MWDELSRKDRDEYKRMMLAFASLTEMFAQKTEDSEDIPAPIINSKYQETVFQKAFHASAEDIGNTSYDVSICQKCADNQLKKYLIGIKTFGINSGDQKVAQFKANITEWASLINQMQENAKESDGTFKTKNEINKENEELYKELAVNISILRNERIRSSIANLQGFKVAEGDEIESVYHVLMPSQKGHDPEIHVGETAYDQIDIEHIQVVGCSSPRNPANFTFSDGKHTYRYTSADSQLYMKFNNEEIVLETWPVRYAEDAYSLFSEIADRIYGEKTEKIEKISESNVKESYSWKINVQRYSGFNSFNGVGSKMGSDIREGRVNRINEAYKDTIKKSILDRTTRKLGEYMLKKAPSADKKVEKEQLRQEIIENANMTENIEFVQDIRKLVYRPATEMYIPIHNSRIFHDEHPDFFGPGVGRFKDNSKKLLLDKDDRKFNLVFEPSGDVLPAFIAQDDGKAIESVEKQTILGEWILKGIFQLKEYEPLTEKKLHDLGINGMRLYKTNENEDVHLEFIWIDDENLPDDFIK